MSVVIETTVGDLTVDLFTDCRPKTCMNFLKLCKMKYYNFNLIFSVERNFIAQTGDPTATGKGGECIYSKMFGDKAKFYEGEKLPIMKHTQLGTVSMVSCGSHLFGSQFFITLGENLDSLDVEHLVFGQVVEGLEVLSRFNQTLTDERNRPYQDIRITHTVILDDPYPDPKEVVFPAESPRPTVDILESDYIAADESVDDTEGKSMTEIQEEIAEREAKARATILEMVGDIPDSDMAPPENVLFVCKLNPVTTSDDLEIIFSRFGKIKSCEVIRDRVTNNSLQYAFIEFAETKSCEDAYFKMDNVLIDDRRIHVDFSQSVSKIKWRGKGRGVEYFDDAGRKVDGRKGHAHSPIQDPGSEPRQGNNHARDQSSGAHSNHLDQRHIRQDSTHQREDVIQVRRHMSSYHRDHEEGVHAQGRESVEWNQKHSGQKEGKDELPNFSKRELNAEKLNLTNDEERERMLKHLKKALKKKKKKSKKYSSDSNTDSSGEEGRKKRSKKKKKKVIESENDSDSDEGDRRKKKKKRKKVNQSEDDIESDEGESRKKKKKKKRKLSESEDSSDFDSEPKRKTKKSKKKKKKKKKKRETSTSSSSDY